MEPATTPLNLNLKSLYINVNSSENKQLASTQPSAPSQSHHGMMADRKLGY
jgi:hypothetical protein